MGRAAPAAARPRRAIGLISAYPLKRSIEIAGHKTSISLEPLYWELLKQAASVEGLPINALVARIGAERIQAPVPPGLAGAVRVWLVAWLAGRLG